VFVYRQEEDIFLFHTISRPAPGPLIQQTPGEEEEEGGLFPAE